jgi:hypothetical protein
VSVAEYDQLARQALAARVSMSRVVKILVLRGMRQDTRGDA